MCSHTAPSARSTRERSEGATRARVRAELRELKLRLSLPKGLSRGTLRDPCPDPFVRTHEKLAPMVPGITPLLVTRTQTYILMKNLHVGSFVLQPSNRGCGSPNVGNLWTSNPQTGFPSRGPVTAPSGQHHTKPLVKCKQREILICSMFTSQSTLGVEILFGRALVPVCWGVGKSRNRPCNHVKRMSKTGLCLRERKVL